MAEKFGVRPVDLPGGAKTGSDQEDTLLSKAAEGRLVDEFEVPDPKKGDLQFEVRVRPDAPRRKDG